MEDVLEVYHRPADPCFPLVCLDETTKQLVAETRRCIAAKPGRTERVDYEYRRNGVATLFMLLAPVQGWRQVEVTKRKTRVDYALCLKRLADEYFPHAARIVLVQDNLNTHHPCSLYEAFSPTEARRLIDRFEFHYTPKHGSWLNMAEIELSVLQRQCLQRRIPDSSSLQTQIENWAEQRNRTHTTIDWRFDTSDARVKLKHLYPSFHVG